mgnify:CR=1 FL=1
MEGTDKTPMTFEEKVQNVKDNFADIISMYLMDALKDVEEKSKVIVELKSLSCCVRCICRFIHLREYKFYREKTEVIYFEFPTLFFFLICRSGFPLCTSFQINLIMK